jgi:hypothetical protein
MHGTGDWSFGLAFGVTALHGVIVFLVYTYVQYRLPVK